MVYKLKAGVHVPQGMTAEGIMRDRALIEQLKGKVTTELATDAIEDDPDAFPTMKLGITWDTELAARKQHESEVRYMFAIVIVQEVIPDHQEAVRAIVSVRDETGDRVWEPVENVLMRPDRRDQLFGEIENDLRDVADKLHELRTLDVALRKQNNGQLP